MTHVFLASVMLGVGGFWDSAINCVERRSFAQLKWVHVIFKASTPGSSVDSGTCDVLVLDSCHSTAASIVAKNMCMTKINISIHCACPNFPFFSDPSESLDFVFLANYLGQSRRIYFRFRACDAMMCSLLANARNGVHRFCGILIWLPPSRL